MSKTDALKAIRRLANASRTRLLNEKDKPLDQAYDVLGMPQAHRLSIVAALEWAEKNRSLT